IWGGLHGFYYLLERFLSPPARAVCDFLRLPERVRGVLQVLLTFHLVLVAWVFFRAGSLQDALLILGRILGGLSSSLYLGASSVGTLTGVALALVLVCVQVLQHYNRLPLYFSRVHLPVPVRWCGYLAMLIGIALLGKSGNDFIYFQF
ncbi:MAG: MBOAT family protein, partial [Planctomycetota bacterium]|nr:MBOAT family protein [Planctomycetota bacterium]